MATLLLPKLTLNKLPTTPLDLAVHVVPLLLEVKIEPEAPTATMLTPSLVEMEYSLTDASDEVLREVHDVYGGCEL